MMVVVDMKDDYGRLRFTPKNPYILSKGRVFALVDLEHFVPTMKAHGVYLVARLVVFKDPELAKRDGGKYAVWDKTLNAPWRGYYETTKKGNNSTESDKTETTEKKYYDEQWVQLFYLNVAYDKVYYKSEYVLQEVRGVRNAGAAGLTYWNNIGRYDEIPFPQLLRTSKTFYQNICLDKTCSFLRFHSAK